MNLAENIFMAAAKNEGTNEVSMEIDPRTDGINIVYNAKPGYPLDREELAAEALATGTAKSFIGSVPVPVTFTEDDSLKSETLVGVKGGHFMGDTQSTKYCTSGFTVAVNGVKGIATAMHCPNYLNYGGQTGVISYQNAASTTSSGAHIDLQWHRVLSGHSASIWFQSTWDAEDFVWAANNARVDDYVCFYGVATADRECDHVMLLNTCYTPADLEFCGLAMTRTSHAQPGDSGGPWYINQNAAGYTSGRKYIFDALHDLFTPGTRVPENLNGRILNYAAGD